MATVTLKYNARNIVVTKMLDAIMHMKEIEKIYPDNELSIEEMKEIEKSLNSGILYDIDKLQAKLRD
jgi:hypothetical protein